MNSVIRQLQGEEMLEAQYNLGQYAFHASPPFQDKEEWLSYARTRRDVTSFGAVEEGQAVSVAAGTAMTQNIRGKLYPATGIWGVATHPSARRKGYCRQALTRLLEAERESGKVFTNLYPFRESFYERLGYVTYPQIRLVRFSPQALAPLLKLDLEGEVVLTQTGDAFDTYRQFIAELRLRRHGMAFFDHADPGNAKRNPQWLALARVNGSVEGLMLYSLQGAHIADFTLRASRFYNLTSRARYLLLNWIARHVDQAGTAELRLAADEMPETWLSDLRVQSATEEMPAPMGRVLDVARMGGMPVGQGAFSARVIDPTCPWNQAAWRFESQAGCLQVSQSSTADCELTIQGLSALVAGTHDPHDFAVRGWGQPDEAASAAMQALFPRLTPFLHEVF